MVTKFLLAAVDELEALERLIDLQIVAAADEAKGGSYVWLGAAAIGLLTVGAWLWRRRSY